MDHKPHTFTNFREKKYANNMHKQENSRGRKRQREYISELLFASNQEKKRRLEERRRVNPILKLIPGEFGKNCRDWCRSTEAKKNVVGRRYGVLQDISQFYFHTLLHNNKPPHNVRVVHITLPFAHTGNLWSMQFGVGMGLKHTDRWNDGKIPMNKLNPEFNEKDTIIGLHIVYKGVRDSFAHSICLYVPKNIKERIIIYDPNHRARKWISPKQLQEIIRDYTSRSMEQNPDLIDISVGCLHTNEDSTGCWGEEERGRCMNMSYMIMILFFVFFKEWHKEKRWYEGVSGARSFFYRFSVERGVSNYISKKIIDSIRYVTEAELRDAMYNIFGCLGEATVRKFNNEFKGELHKVRPHMNYFMDKSRVLATPDSKSIIGVTKYAKGLYENTKKKRRFYPNTPTRKKKKRIE